MTKKIVTMIKAMFLVMFVQGCWADETKEPIQAEVRPNTAPPDKKINHEIVIDDRSVTNTHWCGNKVVMYQVFGGKYDEMSHPIYDQIWWKNIETGKGGMVSDKGGIYGCSPDGQWLIFGEKNFTMTKSEFFKSSLEDAAKKYDIKLKNVETGKEELLPKGDFFVERTANNWSGDGKKVFIRSFNEGLVDVYQPKINKNLEVYYLPYDGKYYTWLPDSNFIIGSKHSEGVGLWSISDKGFSFQKFTYKGEKDFLVERVLYAYAVFDDNKNWYVHHRSRIGGNSSIDNVSQCKVEDTFLDCKKLLPDGVFIPPVYSVLPSGEAIHFLGYLNGSKNGQTSIRYSIDSKKMIDLELYKDKFPIQKLIAGQFSPDGKWVFSRNAEKLVIADMANYYTLFEGSK